jgi:hypothetical protein
LSDRTVRRNLSSWAAIWLVAVFALVYGPKVGHGFVKDDFAWIARSDLRSIDDTHTVLFGAPTGFFRPMVSLSFAANRPLCGLESRCYGLTNLVLAIACAVAIARLAFALALPTAAAVFAGALWMFNWHGIGMSVLWISGRTALIVVLLSTLAATALVRKHPWRAAALSFAAMLAKEEAILLPVILAVWVSVEAWLRDDRSLRRRAIVFAGLSIACTIVYVALRVRSGAFTPSTAPEFYRPSFTLARIVENLPEYLDRSATFSLAVVVLFALVARPALRVTTPSVWPAMWPIARLAALWVVGTLAITVFLPVRSSLYACLPSVGVALAASALLAASWPSISARRQHVAITAGLLIPLLLWPILSVRARKSVREAELSATTIAALRAVASDRGAGTCVLLRDDPSEIPSLASAFGTLGQEAVDLMVDSPIRVWIDPPPADAPPDARPAHVDVELALRNGTIVRSR